MKEIHIDDLVEMLQTGFEGRLNFDGYVTISRAGLSKGDESDPTYYTGEGTFTLNSSGLVSGPMKDSYHLSRGGVNLYFRPKEGINSRNNGMGDILTVPIDFPMKGVLQVTTIRKIIY